jgi:hypothetical protein
MSLSTLRLYPLLLYPPLPPPFSSVSPNAITDGHQDNKPYILHNEARRIANTSSPLSDGFTIISQSVFGNWADHDFYDKECPAHKTLKQTTGPLRTGIQTVVYESEVGVEGMAKL